MSDYLRQVEEQLVELTERGAHRRPRPRLDLVALVAGVVVVAAVALAVSTIGGSARHPGHAAAHHPSSHSVAHHRGPALKTRTVTSSNASTGRAPVGGPVPAGFGPQSFTAISELTWWLLGTAPCSSPPCTSIVRTSDGGRAFVGIPAPRPVQPGDRVSQLRFADPRDGFAYGPGLWVTHDGGAGWQSWSLPGEVRDLAIGGGYAYAILTNPSTGAGQLLRSPVGGDFWKTMSGAGEASGGLWVHGSDVLLEGASQPGGEMELEISGNSGMTFARYPVPPSVACQFEMPAPPVIWAHCATGMMSGTWRSTDGGRHFTAASGSLELPNSAAFGSASASTAVVGYQELYRTTDGGASWAPVPAPPGITWWQYLGFTDPTHGVAIGYVGNLQPGNERLYYTTDGGASYHLVRIR
jgi:hypothetical protein